jgi:lipopolysaccharide transport system ATP-binding protein
MSAVITVENLSKKFVIGHEETEKYTTLRDVLTRRTKKFFSFPRKTVTHTKEEFWALKDINFDIQQGDRVGIIGRNGAGKSTLLKLLSRITEPTQGRITIRGRVASLLEVGTGFHPELTGRENIFLNGAILGMNRAEIRKKFDEIVAFAEVEKFLDTPVKRYSSGMYVRLAFAVAAHLEPEILVVDEVLAVGDAQFQKKCLGKMGEVSRSEGRTILFVSHQMGTILQLCNKGILLNNGQLVVNDNIERVVDRYISENAAAGNKIDKDIINDNDIQFRKIFMTNADGDIKSEYRFDEEVFVRVELFLPKFYDSLELAMRLLDKHKRAVFTIHEKLDRYFDQNPIVILNIVIPKIFLTPGQYSWVMCINHPGVSLYDVHEDIAAFSIIESGSDFSRYEGADYGTVFAQYEVQTIS